MEWLFLIRSIALIFSVFDNDIRNTDVFTGGFNAEYGDEPSIMDFTTRRK